MKKLRKLLRSRAPSICVMTAVGIVWVLLPLRNLEAAASPVVGSASVSLSNVDSNQPIFLFDGVAVSLAPVGTFVDILGRQEPGEPFMIVTSAEGQPIFEMFKPGFFDGGISAVAEWQGGRPAEFIIRAWRGAPTYEAAGQTPTAFAGQSAAFINPTAFYPPPPGIVTPERMRNAPSFTMFQVPEPSILCLAAIAMIMWLSVKRNCKGRKDGSF
jgi:hypothetical protein